MVILNYKVLSGVTSIIRLSQITKKPHHYTLRIIARIPRDSGTLHALNADTMASLGLVSRSRSDTIAPMAHLSTCKLLFILGTRPEAIKCAPLIRLLRHTPGFEVKLCVTGQHRDLLDSALDTFSLIADFDLDVMQESQSLTDITVNCLAGLGPIMEAERPHLVFVQGDTTSALAGALAATYALIPVVHIEAGLRSYDRHAPFPEEINRVLIDQMSTYHFAATDYNVAALSRENITGHVWKVGNTIVDALHYILAHPSTESTVESYLAPLQIPPGAPLLLVTCHRRENWGVPLRDLCAALATLSVRYPDTHIIFAAHSNPMIRDTLRDHLPARSNLHTLPPLPYSAFVGLLNRSHLVITDSGGVQEEAPSLGKPVLVIRDVTERNEGVHLGFAKLIGTTRESIISSVSDLLDHPEHYLAMTPAVNPYGDGHTCQRIIEILRCIINDQSVVT